MLLRALTTGVALAFLAGPLSMVAMDGGSPHGMAHSGHHSGGGHQHQRHQQSDCCESCATHCAAQQGLARPIMIHTAGGSIGRASKFETDGRPVPRHLQLRLPPAQGPPAFLL
jgi:hypothetical protein